MGSYGDFEKMRFEKSQVFVLTGSAIITVRNGLLKCLVIK